MMDYPQFSNYAYLTAYLALCLQPLRTKTQFAVRSMGSCRAGETRWPQVGLQGQNQHLTGLVVTQLGDRGEGYKLPM